MSDLLPDTLQLGPDLLGEIENHAASTYPRECCGILLGSIENNQWRVQRTMPAGNLAQEGVRDRYQLDPRDRFRAETWARQNGCAVIGFYHSHPDHDVYFSKTDLENSEEFLMGQPWLDPTYAYVVISVREGKPVSRGAFRIREGAAERIEVRAD
jgi:proteasome lid subunit RPN8/RPN11